ncbi:MAG: homocysteine S-methyltransferase family protein [Flavobacteriales bacterium]|nr:homocysteine S-methyltransferase family protein [Flavobacteriales bacterium]MCX7767581.1 homocysteine S-methyltransferase family protein [Flavobacteriales bacterium]MDW8410248.1 homocysteine S-methyltransferase family protein [Flavobacteriales bacterium]
MQQRILVLDGAMGTMIQKYGLREEDFRGSRFSSWPRPLKGNNDLLSITQPQIIESIHRQYLEAGADIIETNTFNANSISMADYGMEELVEEMNLAAARLAVEIAAEFTRKNPDKPRFVAGAIGPTNKTASLSPNVNDPGYRAVSFDELEAAYYTQASALVQGGVHILLVETVFDTLNAKAALAAINRLFESLPGPLPVMVSATITDASGRTLSGQTIEAFYISVSHFPLLSIGINCALGAAEMKPYLHALAQFAPCAISAYPNAGLPNAFGAYDQSPEEMAAQVRKFLEDGDVNIIGGCCGTTPEHIRELAALAAQFPPRPIPVLQSA